MKPPIADPFGSPASKEAVENVFFPSFWKLFWANELILFPIFSFDSFAVRSAFRPSQYQQYLLFQLFFFLFPIATAIWSAVSDSNKGLRVTDKGLERNNTWNKRRQIAWEQIQSAKFRWVLLPYVALSPGRKGKSIWIPLFLKDLRGFSRAVGKYAAPDNPLRIFLQKRGY